MNNMKLFYRVSSLLWLTLCVYTLVSYWVDENAWVNSEVYTIYFLKMSVLTLPIGVFFVTIGELILDAIGFNLHLGPKINAIIIWTLLTAFGWLQWFILIPKLYRLIRRKSLQK